jgi:DNA-binding transcriptional ArsR family regulator
MDDEKYVLVSLNDDKTGKIAEAIGNKTCKKILDLLSREEFSEKDISDNLKIPMNTTNYNIKKLKEAGLIEEKKHFFSVKGKRIPVYKVSNKSIVISSKKISFFKLKDSLPMVVVAFLFTGFVLGYEKARKFESSVEEGSMEILGASQKVVADMSISALGISMSILNLFLGFIWFGVLFFVVWCYLSEKKK